MNKIIPANADETIRPALAEAAARVCCQALQLLSDGEITVEDPLSLGMLCDEISTVLLENTNECTTILREIHSCPEEELDELFDELLDCLEELIALRLAVNTLPAESADLDLQKDLGKILELPLFNLLFFLQTMTLRHLNPWAVIDENNQDLSTQEHWLNWEEMLRLAKEIRQKHAARLLSDAFKFDEFFFI